ncbi:MAG: biliverdin-producing heme oxygenase, partial [Methylococcus sp.]
MSTHETAAAPPPGILDRIRRETQAQHKSLERAFRILDPGLTSAAYRHWLERLYGLHAGFEAVIDPWAAALDIDWTNRRKTPWLRRDLLSLGCREVELDGIPICDALPDTDSPGRVFGVLYVLEGSTLGGRHIALALEKRLGLTADNGAMFFNAYGDLLMPRWQSFRARLSAAATTQFVEQQMIGAA